MGYSIEESAAGGAEIISDELIVSGVIAGGGLTYNFVPALFGIHANAAISSFTYNGGDNHDLLSTITWSNANGHEIVTQQITYTNNRPTQIVSTGSVTSKTATETLSWTGDNLTGYGIVFS